MEQIISKEEVDELMKLKGEVRGLTFKTEAEFILKEEGEEGLNKLEDAVAKLGYPIKYKEMRTMDFYPIVIEAVSIIAMKRLFNFDNEKFQELGRFHTKFSLIVRLFMRYFVSLERMAQEVPRIWRQHFTVGDLKLVELNKEKRYLILRLENFRLHPPHCQVIMGIFSTAIQMIVKNKVVCEETECLYRGGKYHQFLLKW